MACMYVFCVCIMFGLFGLFVAPSPLHMPLQLLPVDYMPPFVSIGISWVLCPLPGLEFLARLSLPTVTPE